MSILDLIAEQKSKQRFLTKKSDARDYFVRQKGAIEAISNTQWFTEIRDYWSREVVACQERLQTIKSEDIKWVQEQLKLGMNFLGFLDNLIHSDLTPLEEDF